MWSGIEKLFRLYVFRYKGQNKTRWKTFLWNRRDYSFGHTYRHKSRLDMALWNKSIHVVPIYVATPDDFRTLPVDCTEAVLSLWVCVVLLPFSFLHAQQQRQRAAAYALHLPFYIWQSIWTYGTVIKILISFCLFHPSLKIMLYMFYNLKSFRLKQTV